MSWNLILVVVGGLVAGYAIVSVLMKTGADDLRPPPKPGESPTSHEPAARVQPPRALPAPAATSAARAPRGTDWTLLLDIPRSASARDIEAAFRRQQGKAEAAGDRAMIERLRAARDAALAEVKRRS